MGKLPIVAIACACLLASPAFASTQTQDPAPAPQINPAQVPVRDLDFLVGSWDVVATSPSDGTSETIRYDVRPLTRASWLSGRGSSDTVDASDVWGRDPTTGEVRAGASAPVPSPCRLNFIN